jgi:hypothetical protein
MLDGQLHPCSKCGKLWYCPDMCECTDMDSKTETKDVDGLYDAAWVDEKEQSVRDRSGVPWVEERDQSVYHFEDGTFVTLTPVRDPHRVCINCGLTGIAETCQVCGCHQNGELFTELGDDVLVFRSGEELSLNADGVKASLWGENIHRKASKKERHAAKVLARVLLKGHRTFGDITMLLNHSYVSILSKK